MANYRLYLRYIEFPDCYNHSAFSCALQKSNNFTDKSGWDALKKVIFDRSELISL